MYFVDKLCVHTYWGVSCAHLTSSVVPQDGDAPPLLHIGQFTAWPEHCARADESTNKNTDVVKIKHLWLFKTQTAQTLNISLKFTSLSVVENNQKLI